jgi:hypothetical protein
LKGIYVAVSPSTDGRVLGPGKGFYPPPSPPGAGGLGPGDGGWVLNHPGAFLNSHGLGFPGDVVSSWGGFFLGGKEKRKKKKEKRKKKKEKRKKQLKEKNPCELKCEQHVSLVKALF